MTKEQIIDMARQAGFDSHDMSSDFTCNLDNIEALVRLVAEHEREACAEICDGFYLSWIEIQGRYEFMGEGASECAGAIRARGQE